MKESIGDHFCPDIKIKQRQSCFAPPAQFCESLLALCFPTVRPLVRAWPAKAAFSGRPAKSEMTMGHTF